MYETTIFSCDLVHVCLFLKIVYLYLLGVVSKQLSLLLGRPGDSTAVEDSLSPLMRQLVQDVASCRGDIVGLLAHQE